MQKTLIIITALIAAIACNKKNVEAPAFGVTTNKTTYSKGDTVYFAFTGNPWYISFFSGEPGHKWEYHDRTTADGAPQLQFASIQNVAKQSNTLHILVSTDFSGTYDSANVYKANWTDITSRATLSAGKDTVLSGVVNLGDFVKNDHPAYIAFKYQGYKDTTVQNNWTIRTLTLNNVLPDASSYSLLTNADSTYGFRSVNIKNTAVNWSVSTTALQIKGGTAVNSPEAESWVITKALTLNRVTPDVGVALKNMTTTMPLYTYIYTAPGTYTAGFVASNTNIYGSKDNVQQVSFTVQ